MDDPEQKLNFKKALKVEAEPRIKLQSRGECEVEI
jgi:hypothetical protein